MTTLPFLLAAAAALSPEVDQGVTRAIEDEIREAKAPGAAVAVVKDGEVVYLKAFGVRSAEEPTPVTEDTLFRLGSTTKMMTALVALRDAADRRVDLDAPVRTYAKDLDAAVGKVTLRQLLTHTAGMAEGAPAVQSKDDDGLARMVRGWKANALFTTPGEVFSYTSPGYWLAGYVLEQVHGKAYADVLRERLFDPFGMSTSTLRPLEALTRDFAQGHEGGEELEVVRPMAENTAQYPAGSAFSSARELAKLAEAVLERPPEGFFTATVPLPGGDGATYGFGLVSYEVGGTQVFEHGGVRRGYGSHIRFIPGKRGAVVLMTNRNGVTLRKSLDDITAKVFDLAEAPPPETSAAPVNGADAKRYAGTYAHQDLVTYVVRWDGRQLLLKTDTERPLARARGDTFRTPDGEELTFVFRPGVEKARYLHMDLLTSVRIR